MSEPIQRACVIGLGASGSAAARLLLREGADVVMFDAADSEALREKQSSLQALGACVHLGVDHLDGDLGELIVMSPGVRPDSSLYQAALESGVPMRSELELGWSRRTCPVLAVTGSNGKSTFAKAAAHILNQNGLQAVLCGNYGPPVCDKVQCPADWLVIEVSSFQLETVHEFQPEIGVLLNLLPNHLDRHGSMDDYAGAKSRMFAKSRSGDLCLVEASWLEQVRAWSGGDGQWLSVGDPGVVGVKDGWVCVRGRRVADIRGTAFDNPMQATAVAALLRAVRACGVDYTLAARSLRSFEPLPHRLQKVSEADGITFVNDSKATNLAAMSAAVRERMGRIRLLAGGMAKENDFSSVKDLLAERVSAIYLIGQSAEVMASVWSEDVPCIRCGTLEKAFECAVSEAEEGDTVLLSPACTSFDQFRNYEERGNRFMELVERFARSAEQGEEMRK